MQLLQTRLCRTHKILADEVYMNKRTSVGSNVLVYADNAAISCYKDLVLSNLLQATDSYVIYDPAGALYALLGDFYKEKGYRVVPVKMSVLGDSDATYNPFQYAGNQSSRNYVTSVLEEAGIPPALQEKMPSDSLNLTQMSQHLTAIFCITDPASPAEECLASLLILQALKEATAAVFPVLHTQFMLGDCTLLSKETRDYLSQYAYLLSQRSASFFCRCPSPAQLEKAFGISSASAFQSNCAATLYLADDGGHLAAAIGRSHPLCAELSTFGTGDCYVCTKTKRFSALCFSHKEHPTFRKAFAAGKGGARKA